MTTARLLASGLSPVLTSAMYKSTGDSAYRPVAPNRDHSFANRDN
jgi:hypothetical protein